MAFAFSIVSPAVRARLAAVHDDDDDDDTSSRCGGGDNASHLRDDAHREENEHGDFLGVSARLCVVHDEEEQLEKDEDASPSAQDAARLPLRVAARLGLRKGQLAELAIRKDGESAWGMSRLVRVNGFTTEAEDEATAAAVAIDVRTYPNT